MKNSLKLFIWEGFAPDYTDGMAFSIAENEDEARLLIEKDLMYAVNTWGTLTIYPLKKIGKSVPGSG